LYNDIVTLAHHRDVYRQVTAIIAANPAANVPSAFYDWMAHAYGITQAVALRRLDDKNRRTYSLRLLIQEIADHPEVLSRRRFVGLYRGYLPAHFGHRHFQSVTGPDGRTVDPRLLRRHLRELLRTLHRVHVFVDKNVAHRDRRRMRRLPTYDDLNECVDVIIKLAGELSVLLKAESTTVVPSIPYNWTKPFRVAWLPGGPLSQVTAGGSTPFPAPPAPPSVSPFTPTTRTPGP
jgi:hypothetical protein